MLGLMHSFPILPFLGLFVATEGSLRTQEWLLDAFGWNTLTSKHASWAPFQKPLALMSRRAPSSLLAVRWLRISPDSGCRGG